MLADIVRISKARLLPVHVTCCMIWAKQTAEFKLEVKPPKLHRVLTQVRPYSWNLMTFECTSVIETPHYLSLSHHILVVSLSWIKKYFRVTFHSKSNRKKNHKFCYVQSSSEYSDEQRGQDLAFSWHLKKKKKGGPIDSDEYHFWVITQYKTVFFFNPPIVKDCSQQGWLLNNDNNNI